MSTSNTALLPQIESRIQVICGQWVMIDVDLAKLYGVQTSGSVSRSNATGSAFREIFCFSALSIRRPRWSQIATTTKKFYTAQVRILTNEN